MDYQLNGTFVESCDCYVICPCWVEEDASEDHCTALVAWTLGEGSRINGTPVGGLTVVAVTTHGSSRRGGDSQTVLFVDQRANDQQHGMLSQAFAGQIGGPLTALASVSGDILLSTPADVTVDNDGYRWRVNVQGSVAAEGRAMYFDDRAQPLTLANTAMTDEFGLGGGSVTAHQATRLKFDVAPLPGGFIDVEGRSGMTGEFRYVYDDEDDLEDEE